MRPINRSWHSTLLASLCGLAGIALITLFSWNSRIINFDIFVVYASSIPALFWIGLGYLLFHRSKYVLPATICAIAANYLVTPLSVYVIRWKYGLDLSEFNYEYEVRRRFAVLGIPDAAFQIVLFFYALWHSKFVLTKE